MAMPLSLDAFDDIDLPMPSPTGGRMTPTATHSGSGSLGYTASSGSDRIESPSSGEVVVDKRLAFERPGKRRRRELSPNTTTDASALPAAATTTSVGAAGGVMDPTDLRWMRSVEACNVALTSSVDVLTRNQTALETRERALRRENENLHNQVLDVNARLRSLEGMLAEQKEKTMAAQQQLANVLREGSGGGSGASSTRYSGGAGDDDADSPHVRELKESLRTVTQLLLSTGPLDAQTTKLLHVLTAQIGGLAAVGSRSGVLGIQQRGGGTTADPGATPLSLMGAATAPILSAPESSSNRTFKTMTAGLSETSRPTVSGGAPFTLSFNFTTPRKRLSSTVFGVMFGVGITWCVSADMAALTHPHARQDPLLAYHSDHTHHTHHRRLLSENGGEEITAADADHPLYHLFCHVVLYAVIAAGVLAWAVVLTSAASALWGKAVQAAGALFEEEELLTAERADRRAAPPARRWLSLPLPTLWRTAKPANLQS